MAKVGTSGSEIKAKSAQISKAYPADIPSALRPSSLTPGAWTLGAMVSSNFAAAVPSSFALQSYYPLNERTQVSASTTTINQESSLLQQNVSLGAHYQLLQQTDWSALLSLAWTQDLYSRPQAGNALATSGSVSYRLSDGPWYLVGTQLLRYHFSAYNEHVQATTSLLGGRQVASRVWVNVGVSPFDFSSNGRATRNIFDPRPLYLNCVWAFSPTTDITGSVASGHLPLQRQGVGMMVGINVRTGV
jgi:hypothetical protein